ncbi:MAG: aromatic amino acid transport family protein [Pseudomonadota bacterium]
MADQTASGTAHAPHLGRDDREWLLSLFGTAVGAGILFLPLNAGAGGIWPLIFLTILIGPMTFLAHRGLSRVCLAQSKKEGDITDAVEEHFGPAMGTLITFGYFIAIFPIVMIYGISLTNIINEVITVQLGLGEPPRAIVSFFCVGILVAIMMGGSEVILKVTEIVVWPLLAVILGLSLYLIPQWSLDQFSEPFDIGTFLFTIVLTLPVLVFAFNHSPAVSTFVHYFRHNYGDRAEKLTSRVLFRNAALLTIFIMFFVFSCVLTMTPEEVDQAKALNLPILTILAQSSDSAIFGWLAILVAFVAIVSSFFGHFMGAHEGLKGLVVEAIHSRSPGREINHRRLNLISALVIFLILWAIAYLNVSVMNLIEALVAPILAIILFIMPVIAKWTVPAMKRFRSGWDPIVAGLGVVTIIGFVLTNFVL